MASAIDATKPVSGNPTTASVRANMLAAKNEIEALQAKLDYIVNIGTTAVEINGSGGTVGIPPISDHSLRLYGSSTKQSGIAQFAWGQNTQFQGFVAGGTPSSPSAVVGQNIAIFGAGGYDGTAWVTSNRGAVVIAGGGTWTVSSNPTVVRLSNTKTGETALQGRLQLNPSGSIVIAPTGDFSESGSAQLQVKGGFAVNSGAATFQGGVTLANSIGINFGTQVAGSPTDLSKHISLYATGYGFGVTGSRLNYNAPVAAQHMFLVGTVDVFSAQSTGITVGNTAYAGNVFAILDTVAGNNRIIRFRTAGLARWDVLANSAAEGGANAGSGFNINRYNDAGTVVATSFAISRASGLISLNEGAMIANGITQGSTAGPVIQIGTATPEASLTAPVGSQFANTSSGTHYIKQTGTGNTGWLPLLPSPQLSNNGTLVNSGSVVGTEILRSYTLAASSLVNVGDRVHLKAVGGAAADTNNKAVRLKFGTITSQINCTTTAQTSWINEMWVTKTGSNTQTWEGNVQSRLTAGVPQFGTATITDTNAIVCSIEIENITTAAANSGSVQQFLVEYYPARV